MVSYARSTYEKAKQFREKLEELQKTTDLITVRTYLAAKGTPSKEHAVSILHLNDSEIARIEALKDLRMSGIQAEMKYALAQAKKSGVQLPQDVISGEAILPAFRKEVLEKVPSLGVYDLFLLFTEQELDNLSERG